MASQRSVPTAIALGGIIAATLDIGAAMLISGASLTPILHYVTTPLSAVGQIPPLSLEGLINNGLTMLAFGLIVAWFARRSLPAD